MINCTSDWKEWLTSGDYTVMITLNNQTLTNLDIPFSDVVQNSLVVNRFSVTGGQIEVGSATAAEVQFTLDNSVAKAREAANEIDYNYDDVVFEGARISFAFKHENSALYFIIATVDEVTRQGDLIHLVLLDDMVKLDKPVSGTIQTNVSSLISAICTAGGFQYASAESSLVNLSVTLAAPTSENLTYRQLLQWVCQVTGTCAYMAVISGVSKLVLDWYSKTYLAVPSGVTFDETETYYTESNGVYTEADISAFASGTTYYRIERLKPSNRFSSTIDQQPITITGVSVKVGDTAYESKTNANYVLAIENNELIDATNAQTIATGLASRLNGFSYTPFSAETNGLIWLQPLDMVVFTDKSGTDHDVIITDWTFSPYANVKLEGKGESQTRKGYATNAPFTAEQTKIIEEIKRNQQEVDVDDRITAVLGLNDAINHGMMLNTTTVDGKVYRHNASTLADSTYICTANSGGFAWTNAGWNSGNPVWQYGISSDGSAVLEQLSAYSINADVVSTGILQSSDGSTTLNLDNNTASFFDGALLYDTTNGFRFGTNVTFGTSNLSQDVLSAISAKGSYYGSVVDIDGDSTNYDTFVTDIATGAAITKGQTFIVNCPNGVEDQTPHEVYQAELVSVGGNTYGNTFYNDTFYFQLSENNLPTSVEPGQIYELSWTNINNGYPELFYNFYMDGNGVPTLANRGTSYIIKYGNTTYAQLELQSYTAGRDYSTPTTIRLFVDRSINQNYPQFRVTELTGSGTSTKSIPYFHAFAKSNNAIANVDTKIQVTTTANTQVNLVVQNYDTTKFDYATPTSLQLVATEQVSNSTDWKCEIAQTTGDARAASALSTANAALAAVEDIDVDEAVQDALADFDFEAITTTFYGTCSTTASTATKTVICPEITAASLKPGTILNVRFTNENTATSPTITLKTALSGGTTVSYGKYITANGTTLESGSVYNWQADSVVQFVYYESGNTNYWSMTESAMNKRIAAWCDANDTTMIDGSKIYTGTIGATQIAAGAVDADKIYASDAMFEKLMSKDALVTGTLSFKPFTGDNPESTTAEQNYVARFFYGKDYSELTGSMSGDQANVNAQIYKIKRMFGSSLALVEASTNGFKYDYSGTCGTAKATQIKDVTLTGFSASDFTAGKLIKITFTYGNQSNIQPKLQIYNNGIAVGEPHDLKNYEGNALGSLDNGAVRQFEFDGTNWKLSFYWNYTTSQTGALCADGLLMDYYFNESTIVSRVFSYLSTYVGDDYTILPALYAKKLYIDGVKVETQSGIAEYTIARYSGQSDTINFPKSFSVKPSVQITIESDNTNLRSQMLYSLSAVTTTNFSFYIHNVPSSAYDETIYIHWTASIPSD